MSTRGGRSIAVAAMTCALAAALAACGGDDDTTAPPRTTTTTAGAAETTAPPAAGTAQPFGPACPTVLSAGTGGFSAMADQAVAAAAAQNAQLSTFVAALRASDLGLALDAKPALTVFAPANIAFGKLPKRTLDALLGDPSGRLSRVLQYHVVLGRLTPDHLAGAHTTLEGEALTVAGSGADYTINGRADVVCGNVPTLNATVYIIDEVLMPPTLT